MIESDPHRSRLVEKENARLMKLVDLPLQNNYLYAFPSRISECLNLRKLDLSANPLHYIPPGSLTSLKNLEICILSRCFFTAIPEDLPTLPSLRSLEFSENYIDKFPVKANQWKRLEKLILSKNPLRKVSAEICDLPSLRIFRCKHNPAHHLIKKSQVSKVSLSILQSCWKNLRPFFKFSFARTMEYEPISKFALLYKELVIVDLYQKTTDNSYEKTINKLSLSDQKTIKEGKFKNVHALTCFVRDLIKKKYNDLDRQIKKKIGLGKKSHSYYCLLADALYFDKKYYFDGLHFEPDFYKTDACKIILKDYKYIQILKAINAIKKNIEFHLFMRQNYVAHPDKLLRTTIDQGIPFKGFAVMHQDQNLIPTLKWKPHLPHLIGSEHKLFYYKQGVVKQPLEVIGGFKDTHSMHLAFQFFKTSLPNAYIENSYEAHNWWIRCMLRDLFQVNSSKVVVRTPQIIFTSINSPTHIIQDPLEVQDPFPTTVNRLWYAHTGAVVSCLSKLYVFDPVCQRPVLLSLWQSGFLNKNLSFSHGTSLNFNKNPGFNHLHARYAYEILSHQMNDGKKIHF